VLIREDFNVPVADGRVTSDARLRAALPTLRRALEARARVLVMSHLGRPKEGERDPALSLAPVAKSLGGLLGIPVRFHDGELDAAAAEPGELVLLENVRFLKGEKKDDAALAKRMAALCDVFVMDAFGTAHRAEASTHGVALAAPVACAGTAARGRARRARACARQPEAPAGRRGRWIEGLDQARGAREPHREGRPARGRRRHRQHLLAATGVGVGKSLHEADMLDVASRLLAQAKARGVGLPIPTDVVVATEFSPTAMSRVRDAHAVGAEEMILDIGPDSAKAVAEVVAKAGTVIWNGPLGVFEFDAFAGGTRALAEAIAKSKAFSIAGGGDTLAAIEKFGVERDISYISTGGGAFLEFVEGKTLRRSPRSSGARPRRGRHAWHGGGR
jgi:phosphoglycerate kinase